MLQDGLIHSIFELLVLDNGMETKKSMPSKVNPLVKYIYFPTAHRHLGCSSVVVILIYLTVSTYPFISYDVNWCAKYMFAPNNFHRLALKRISFYLKATMNKGLVLNP